MLPRLKHIAGPIAQAHEPEQVIEALDKIVSPVVQVGGIARSQELLVYHPRAPAQFRTDYVSALSTYGRSLMSRRAETNPLPSTLTEAMRMAQPTGKDRWLLDLFRDCGTRDGFYCSYGPWYVIFTSDYALKEAELERETRMALDAGGEMAVYRLKEIIEPVTPGASSGERRRNSTPLLNSTPLR